MSYWFLDPMLKALFPLALSTTVKGLSSVFSTPTLIMGSNVFPEGPVLGPSVVDIWGARCEKKKAFIVTDEAAERFAKIAAKTLEGGGFATEIWNKALPEAPMSNVKEGGDAMTAFAPDLIVAVGGGSVMDGAKAAWIHYERPDIEYLGAISPLETLGLRKKAIFAAVPTTSGTGSECTGVSVLTDEEVHRKIPLANADLLPDFAVLDPAFTVTMPPKLTVGTGLDALSHAVDTVAIVSSNEITDALALASIEMIFKYLPRAYVEGHDREARFRMHVAASTAGIAFGANSTALTHSFGHSLGGLFKIHHGLACGVFIPYNFQFYAKTSDKFLNIARALRVEGETKEETLNNLVDAMRSFFKKLDVPLTLKDMGIPKDEFEEKMDQLVLYAHEDISTFFSPRPITKAQCEQVFRCAYDGKDIDF
ncbi:MAG: iron-containing alcohol dehydrogenase [Deltaproteobacteria bacterium]|nr:iron-containing alcohol dehydrogenase [Deltaproteobacteria bacterium]MBW2051164.1 iron-containing alcohol dehydrogenase [Deltaproteobacteria bacterium]MBW2140010.1 iron-containing alcohol dehydrogenase [Deltaproteobacteria bacterium]MBW2322332.1 iron-containing alcohol dehydrogenase [Deltaproteobacteria bacterium]